jgi:hypothetical protein
MPFSRFGAFVWSQGKDSCGQWRVGTAVCLNSEAGAYTSETIIAVHDAFWINDQGLRSPRPEQLV